MNEVVAEPHLGDPAPALSPPFSPALTCPARRMAHHDAGHAAEVPARGPGSALEVALSGCARERSCNESGPARSYVFFHEIWCDGVHIWDVPYSNPDHVAQALQLRNTGAGACLLPGSRLGMAGSMQKDGPVVTEVAPEGRPGSIPDARSRGLKACLPAPCKLQCSIQ